MVNPAKALADLFVTWPASVGEAPATKRAITGNVKTGTQPYWRYINSAALLLEELEATFDQMEASGRDVSYFREILPPCYQAAYMPETAWGQPIATGRTGQLLSNSQVAHLRVIGDAIDHLDRPDHLSIDRIEGIITGLQGVLEEVELLPESAASDHLRWQVEQALHFATRVDVFGGPAVVDTAAAVVISVERTLEEQEEVIGPERTSRLRRFARDIGVNLLSSAVYQFGPESIGPVVDMAQRMLEQ